jgi:hypothetical protein
VESGGADYVGAPGMPSLRLRLVPASRFRGNEDALLPVYGMVVIEAWSWSGSSADRCHRIDASCRCPPASKWSDSRRSCWDQSATGMRNSSRQPTRGSARAYTAAVVSTVSASLRSGMLVAVLRGGFFRQLGFPSCWRSSGRLRTRAVDEAPRKRWSNTGSNPEREPSCRLFGLGDSGRGFGGRVGPRRQFTTVPVHREGFAPSWYLRGSGAQAGSVSAPIQRNFPCPR